MLIPYDPLYYLSDADHDIADQSNISMTEVRKTFHDKADYYTYAALSEKFRTVDLLHDTSAGAEEDLITVFSTLGYKYETPMHVNPDARKLKPETVKKEFSENPATATKYKSLQGDLKYMNAILGKAALLDALAKKYSVEYFVFLNQFEIKTNFNSCLDIANKIYQRTTLLHFSIYDKSGKQIAGNFSYCFFPSNSSDSNIIIGNCFADLGNGVAKSFTDAIFSNQTRK